MARTSARERLLDCAEQLFAEHGVEGVSLRTINANAGLSPAALHYHFGTKQKLLEALLGRRMSALMERREALFDALVEAPEPPGARQIMQALVQPLAELIARDGEAGLRYVRLLCRLQADGGFDRDFVRARYAGAIAHVEPLLSAALPSLAPDQLRIRAGLAIDLMLRGLADWASFSGSRDAPPSLDAFVSGLLDFLAGGLEAAESS
jgi:AcrR family transcriptional regulator